MRFLVFILGLGLLGASAMNLDEFERIINIISKIPEFEADFQENIKTALEIEPNYFDYNPFESKDFTFNCNFNSSSEKPLSVHRLRPSDIKVVAALGDSLTASLGSNARTILGLLLEYRGRSWSIGGNNQLEKLLTVPNIIKKFNPLVTGFSEGVDLSLVTKTGKGLNVAVSGQEANHIPDQARILIDRLRSDKNIDFENDWKLITLFIGGNDLCDFCKDKNLHSPDSYINYIREGLDMLYKQVPKAFVNFVSVLNVVDVKMLNKGLVCSLLHNFECPCAAFPKSEQEEKELKQYLDQYQNYTLNLVNSGRYDGRDDFTVVVQPFFTQFKVPKLANGKVDFSFFAPDCFHFSTKGQSKFKESFKKN